MLWCECTPLGSHNIPCSRGDSFCRDTGSRNTGVLLAQLGKQGYITSFFPHQLKVHRERNWWSTTELDNLLLSFSIGRDGLLSCGSEGIPQQILQEGGWSSPLKRRGRCKEEGAALLLGGEGLCFCFSVVWASSVLGWPSSSSALTCCCR